MLRGTFLVFAAFLMISIARAQNEIDLLIKKLPLSLSQKIGTAVIEPYLNEDHSFESFSTNPEIKLYKSKDVTHLQLSPQIIKQIENNIPLTNEIKIAILFEFIQSANFKIDFKFAVRKLSECKHVRSTSSQESCRQNFWNTSGLYSNDKMLKRIYKLYRTQEQELIIKKVNNQSAFFSTHLAQSLIDESYSCRFLSMNLFFKKIFYTDSINEKKCEAVIPVRYWQSNQVENIDLEKIDSIQIIKVAPGTGMSKWGHIMFNIKLCTIDTVASCDPEDIKDIIFSIHESTTNTNSLAGIFGFSKLIGDFMSPTEAYYGYTVAEKREMTAFYLHLSSEEELRLVSMMIEIHLRGYGNWNHLLKNCTTTAAFLLNESLDNNNEIQATTPSELEEKILSFYSSNEKLVEFTKVVQKASKFK